MSIRAMARTPHRSRRRIRKASADSQPLLSSLRRVMRAERAEAFLASRVEAFTFFGFVPREVRRDDLTTVVTRIFKGRERKPGERCVALASHYALDPPFCVPAFLARAIASNTTTLLSWPTANACIAQLDTLFV